ncbi:MAG: RIP metalloprotease RseP [Aquificota bacterium]|nr:RIP metalloprotease RseP [Aquificota bacterium]
METVIAFLVLVGVLIWFHELGHFLFARIFGVKVEVFSVGFGPPLVTKKVGDTVYQIAAIPLGGFVKLYGENERTDDPQAFSSKPPWQRILIALAGPLFNFLLTIVLFTAVFSLGVDVPRYMKEPPLVGFVEEDSWADRAGIRSGDRVLSIGGVETERWEDIRRVLIDLMVRDEKRVEVVVLREGKEVRLTTTLPEMETGREVLGIHPHLPPVIGGVAERIPGVGLSPAYQVGLKAGDRIVSVNGKKVESWYEVVREIRSSGGKPVVLVILRDGEKITKEVVPAVDPKRRIPVIGISPKVETVRESFPLGEAFVKALERTYDLFILTFKVLWGLITGAVSLKTLGGPIAIAQFAGQAAQSGLVPYLSSMAFISLQLGIFNLLPLPVLDGGLILLFLIEMVRRKPLPDKFKEYWQRVGFALIISLMVFVVVNDLLRVVGK